MGTQKIAKISIGQNSQCKNAKISTQLIVTLRYGTRRSMVLRHRYGVYIIYGYGKPEKKGGSSKKCTTLCAKSVPVFGLPTFLQGRKRGVSI